MWEGRGGGARESVEGCCCWTAAASSLLSPLGAAGGSGAGVGAGSVAVVVEEDSGVWLGGVGSMEWRLVTGVILLGGVGGDRLAGAGTTMMPLPDCESSAVNKPQV